MGLQDNGTFANTSAGDVVAAAQAAWHIDACCDGFDVVSDGNRVADALLRVLDRAPQLELHVRLDTRGGEQPPGCCPQFATPISSRRSQTGSTSRPRVRAVRDDRHHAGQRRLEPDRGRLQPGRRVLRGQRVVLRRHAHVLRWSGSCRPDGTNQLWSYTGTGAGDTWDRIDDNDGLAGGFGSSPPIRTTRTALRVLPRVA